MRVKRLIVTSFLVLCLSLALAGPAAGQDITDLVFCIDGSGSLGAGGWQTQIAGTAAALLNQIPHNGTVRITVIQFSDGSQTVVGPVIVTNANADALADQITALPFPGGMTNTASCLNQAVTELDGLMPPSTRRVIDVSTDGQPNRPVMNPGPAALQAADAAMAAGVDQINALGIGLGNGGQMFLDTLVRPQTGTPGDGFVINIDNLNTYEEAIAEKVAREIDICARLDDFEATCATDASGVVNVTLTFTNFLTDENDIPFDAEHVWITDPSLVGGPALSVTPNYFSFQNDPICSAADPNCPDPTRTVSFAVTGAPDGGQMQFTFELHDEDLEPCCEEIFIIELPDCDCGQVLFEDVHCHWRWPPPPLFHYTFRFQNLFTEVVEEIRLTPTAPQSPDIGFNPNIIDGLALQPPPVAGTATNTVEIVGPSAVEGQHVEFLISTHNANGQCCSIRSEIDLPFCPWRRHWPHVSLPFSQEIFVENLEVGFEVRGLGPSGHGVKIPTEQAAGAVVSLGISASDTVEGSHVRFEASGSIQGFDEVLSGVTVSSVPGGTQATVDSSLGLVGAVEFYLHGQIVLATSLDGSNSVTLPEGLWPSGLAFQGSDGAIALTLPEAVMLTVAGQPVVANQIVFGIATAIFADALTEIAITGGGIEALTLDTAIYPIDGR